MLRLEKPVLPFIALTISFVGLAGVPTEPGLELTPIGVRGTPLDVQFETPVFADGFESGDISAWSN